VILRPPRKPAEDVGGMAVGERASHRTGRGRFSHAVSFGAVGASDCIVGAGQRMDIEYKTNPLKDG